MIEAAVIAVAGVAAGAVGAFLVVRRFRTIRAQLLVLMVAVSCLPAAGIVLGGLVMFTRHDLFVLSLLSSVSGVTAAGLAWFMANRIAREVVRMRDVAAVLAEGDLGARMATSGPAELAELARTFNEMAGRLGRLFETRRNLVAWASHDLRAPLASLQVMVEALEDGIGDAAEYLPAMRAQVRTLSTLVDDLFELSRIEMGTLSLAMIDVRVNELVDGCISSLRPDAERRRITLESNGSEASATVRCDPDKVGRVLLNLVGNALRHTPEDGSVAVHVGADDGVVTVAVEDTGEGLPAGSAERLFESFWRADHSRTATTGGTGLGLAIARGLVEAHGGRIWAEDAATGGARFVFTLPAT